LNDRDRRAEAGLVTSVFNKSKLVGHICAHPRDEPRRAARTCKKKRGRTKKCPTAPPRRTFCKAKFTPCKQNICSLSRRYFRLRTRKARELEIAKYVFILFFFVSFLFSLSLFLSLSPGIVTHRRYYAMMKQEFTLFARVNRYRDAQ
jgi:hypothetical protein